MLHEISRILGRASVNRPGFGVARSIDSKARLYPIRHRSVQPTQINLELLGPGRSRMVLPVASGHRR